MDLFDLFALYHKQGEYMKYNDFQKIGWTEKDYIYYIRSCEQIRSALISIHTMQEKLRVPQELRNVIGRNSFSYDELYEAIVQACCPEDCSCSGPGFQAPCSGEPRVFGGSRCLRPGG